MSAGQVHHLSYNGDVGAVCKALFEFIHSKPASDAWVLIHLSGASSSPDAGSHLRSFRRLIRLSPYAVFCKVEVQKLSAVDFLVAMTCDGAEFEHKDVEVTGEGMEKEMAKKHFQIFSGEAAKPGALWPSRAISWKPDFFGPWMQGFPKMVPYVWMGVRHTGLVLLNRLTKNYEPTPEQVRAMEDGYSSTKVAALFSSFDSLKNTPCMEVNADDEDVDKAAAAAINVTKMEGDSVEATISADIIFASVPVIQKSMAFAADKAVRKVALRLVDGEIATANSIFPRGVSDHPSLFKWHRKFEQVLHNLAVKDLTCTVEGDDICPPLLELFFTAQTRIWASCERHINFSRFPFWYSPGPEAMKGSLLKVPVSKLRQFLTEGLPVKELEVFGVVKDMYSASPSMGKTKTGSMKKTSTSSMGKTSTSSMGKTKSSMGYPLAGGSAMGKTKSSMMGKASTVGKDGLLQVDEALQEEYLDDFPGECIVEEDMGSPAFRAAATHVDGGWEYGGGLLRLPPQEERPKCKRGACSFVGYGLATPGEEHKWTQAKVADMLHIPEGHPHRSLFKASHIETRYLAELMRDLEDPAKVSLERLRAKHLEWSKFMLSKAIKDACQDAGIEPSVLRHISVCSTSGYLLPGLTAFVAQDPTLGISPEVSRADLVGMGCHAGLNSVKSAAAWAQLNPGKYAVACGVEVMSAQYVWGDVTRTNLNNVICNSLFGDGCFAAIFYTAPEDTAPPKAYLDLPAKWWTQLVDTGALDDMIYRVEPSENKYRFDLSELAPYHVAQGLLAMMRSALNLQIPVHFADHVCIHTGGRTVLNCSMAGLALEGDPQKKVPHTVESLREYGNQSSSSFMFAFDKLVNSGRVSVGDAGLFVTMGPGAGLEMAMWTAGEKFLEAYPHD